MTRFTHASDLHLSREDRGYSLAVLEELIAKTIASGAEFLVISGDIFDSFADAVALSPKVASMLAPLAANIPVYAIAGNHDLAGCNGKPFPLPPLKGITMAVDRVLLVETNPSADILLIPHGTDLRALAAQGLERADPAKYLIAVSHGSLADAVWTGPDETGGSDAFECLSFRKLGADYAALGHIHARSSLTKDGTVFAYPGSAIVWRKGESGRRCALLAMFEGRGTVAKTEPLWLDAAGLWLEKTAVLEDESGALDTIMAACAQGSALDSLFVTLEGMVASDAVLDRLKSDASAALVPSRVRKLDWDDTDLVRYENLLAHPAALAFTHAWKEKRVSLESRFGAKAAARALSRGLLSIKNAVEAQS